MNESIVATLHASIHPGRPTPTHRVLRGVRIGLDDLGVLELGGPRQPRRRLRRALEIGAVVVVVGGSIEIDEPVRLVAVR